MKHLTKRILIKTALTAALIAGVAGLISTSRFNSLISKSAVMKEVATSQENARYLVKRKAMHKVLSAYNSPLVDHVDGFIDACRKYNIDCYLLPSISGIESTFGKQLLPGTYNPFGWGGGTIVFNSWEHGFETVAKGLRENYINRGAETIEQIGFIYCPPNATWSTKVRFFMSKFEAAEAEIVTPARL